VLRRQQLELLLLLLLCVLLCVLLLHALLKRLQLPLLWQRRWGAFSRGMRRQRGNDFLRAVHVTARRRPKVAVGMRVWWRVLRGRERVRGLRIASGLLLLWFGVWFLWWFLRFVVVLQSRARGTGLEDTASCACVHANTCACVEEQKSADRREEISRKAIGAEPLEWCRDNKGVTS